MRFEDRSEIKIEIEEDLLGDMEFTLSKHGELEWISRIPGKLHVQYAHKKDIKQQMKLMQITTLGTLLTGELPQGRVSFRLSGDKKYMIFEEIPKRKG